MCKSAAEGGQRCAAHTRPAYEAATFGTPEWDQAAAVYASSPGGRRDLTNTLDAADRAGDLARSAALTTALRRGKALREANGETRNIIDLEHATTPTPDLPAGWSTGTKGHQVFWNKIDQHFIAPGADVRVHKGTKITPEELATVLRTLDESLRAYDFPPVRVNINGQAFKGSHSGSASKSYDLDGNPVYIIEIGSYAWKAPTAHVSPSIAPASASEGVGPLKHTIVHELGHILDAAHHHTGHVHASGESDPTHKRRATAFHKKTTVTGMNSYGRSEAAEGYAEAFSQWLLSDRTHGDHDATADAYAREYGWTTERT